jgi:hypothetical protein
MALLQDEDRHRMSGTDFSHLKVYSMYMNRRSSLTTTVFLRSKTFALVISFLVNRFRLL